MDKKVCAIIISYNKVSPVIRAIKSVFRSYSNSKVILIDNSEDMNIFKILKHKLRTYSNITFIKNKDNLGFAKAVNQGIKVALRERTDYILLLNDDAYLERNCINYLIDALEKDKKALLAGPTIFYHKDRNMIWHTGGYFRKLLGSVYIPYKNKKLPFSYFKTLAPKEVDFLTGCVLLIKKEAIEKVGIFDEQLFFYGEDLDYSLRVRKMGYKLIWVPYAFAWHDIEIEKGRTSPFVMRNLARSNLVLRKKHFNVSYFIYYVFLHFVLYTPYRLYQILKGSKNIASIKAWLKGSLEGVFGG